MSIKTSGYYNILKLKYEYSLRKYSLIDLYINSQELKSIIESWTVQKIYFVSIKNIVYHIHANFKISKLTEYPKCTFKIIK